MTEQTNENAKTAVESMRRAKQNMEDVIARNSTLEHALRKAIAALQECKTFIPSNVYPYKSDCSVHARIDESVNAINKVL